MQVVDADDLVRVPDFIRHGSQVDVGRCSLQEEVHGFADDPPGSPGDEGSDAEGEDGPGAAGWSRGDARRPTTRSTDRGWRYGTRARRARPRAHLPFPTPMVPPPPPRDPPTPWDSGTEARRIGKPTVGGGRIV